MPSVSLQIKTLEKIKNNSLKHFLEEVVHSNRNLNNQDADISLMEPNSSSQNFPRSMNAPTMPQRNQNYAINSPHESNYARAYESAYPQRSQNFNYPSSNMYQQQQYVYHQNNVVSTQNDYSNNDQSNQYNDY